MRNETKYNELVGRIGNEYYFCDDIFKYEDGMKGATGSIMSAISNEEYEERVSTDNIKDYIMELWQGVVANGNYEGSLNEYIDEIYDIDEIMFDLSDREYNDFLFDNGYLNEKEYKLAECIGGGRCFNKDLAFDEVYNNELWSKIKAIEDII